MPDGVSLEFPDGMSQDAIRTVIRSKYKPAAVEPQPSSHEEAQPRVDLAALDRDVERLSRKPELDAGIKGEGIFQEGGPVSFEQQKRGLQIETSPIVPIPKAKADNPMFKAFLTGVIGRPPSEGESRLAASVANEAGGFAEFFESPMGLQSLALGASGKLAQKILGVLFLGETARETPAAITRAKEAKTPQEKMDAYVHLGAMAGVGAGLAKGLMPARELSGVKPSVQPAKPIEQSAAEVVGPATAAAVKEAGPQPKIETEATDASSQQKAAEVHGDVRTQPIQGEQGVPVEGSGEGVQPLQGGVNAPKLVGSAQGEVRGEVGAPATVEPVSQPQTRTTNRQFKDFPKGTAVELTGKKTGYAQSEVEVKFPDGSVVSFPPEWLQSEKAAPKESLPAMVKRLGRSKVEELIGQWDSDAMLSEDGKRIVTLTDPRNRKGKTKASVREFQDWLQSEGATKSTTPPPEAKGEAQVGPGIVGMGGATPSEFEPVGKSITGIKNATVDQERASRGLPPAIEPIRRTFGEVWDKAMAQVDRAPETQDALIDELRQNPRALTDVEDALVLHRQVDLQNEFAKATRDLAQAYDDGRMEDVTREKLRVNELSDKLLDLYNIGKKVGTETGRGLAARKMMANEDFTLAKMEMETRAAKGGRPLTDAERAEVQQLHDKISETQKAFDDYKEQAEQRIRELEAERATKEMVQEADAEEKATRSGKRKAAKAPATPEEVTAGIRKAAGEGTPLEDLGNWIQKLAESFVRSGIKTRDPLIDAVHGVVSEIFPGVARRDVMDAISGYGQFKPLNKDQIKAELRDLKGQMQQVGKLEDMQQGQAPAKTGVERRIPSDEERRLIKLVNEMKKKGGFEVTDPEKQLKSALDAIKTRLTNQIKDLEFQIATGKKIVREKGAPPSDAETEVLRKRRDELKAQFDDIFGKPELTDEQRVKMAMGAVERSIEDLETRIKNKDLGPRTRESKTPSTPELEAARARRDALKEELQHMRDLANPKKTPGEIALAALKTRLTNRTAELMDKIARGDFSTKPRKPVTLDAESQRLKAENERWKRAYFEARSKDRMERRTSWEKAADTFVKWRRGYVLSGFTTLAKLTSAAAQRMTFTPLEEALGAGLGKIPGVSEVAARSPIEAGLSPRAESKALSEGFSKGMRDAAQTLRTGHSDLDLLYGKVDVMPKAVIDFFGHLHGALKAPTKRNAFERAMAKQFEFGIRNGVDVTDPMVQTAYAIKAYREANRSIFLNDNRVVTAWKRAVSALEEKNKATGQPTAGGKAAATAAKMLLPIVKVPTNIVAETLQYSTGLVTGSAKLANALRKGVDKLPPDEADLIMRHLKKGSIGAAVMLLGYLNPEVVGGYYQQGQKRHPDDVKFGTVRLYGTDIPSFLLHNPLLETLQIGATIRRVSESKLKKKDPDEQGLTAGVMAGALGLVEEVPFMREMIELNKLFNSREKNAFAGEMAKSFVVPQLIQNIANMTDKDEPTVWNILMGQDTVRRAPETIVEHIETGIPGLRQTVEEKIDKRR